MASIIDGFEYDIFISYRHNDNRSGWVSDFVEALQEELATTIKEPLTIYFDKNPYDGLLETHNVDKSLESKLQCLIFIPIISQTYCDLRSFAWQREFCVFNKLSKEHTLGRDIKIGNGNVASRILPVKIHDLDTPDKLNIEHEIGAALRAIDFIYKEPGVNRPLRSTDERSINHNKTDYRNQVNKVANAIKDLVNAITADPSLKMPAQPVPKQKGSFKARNAIVPALVVIATFILLFNFFRDTSAEKSELDKILDRAEGYLRERDRFDDDRYLTNARQAAGKALALDSMNERGLYLMSLVGEESGTGRYIEKLERHYPDGEYTALAAAGRFGEHRQWQKGITKLESLIEHDPTNKDALKMLCVFTWQSGNYISAVQYEKQLRKATGEGLPDVLSEIYLELGDFEEAERQLKLKQLRKEFGCGDVEEWQRIFLCSGDFEKLERLTDSICQATKCDQCPFWKLRAKVHTAKFNEALLLVRAAVSKKIPLITRRTPAYVLLKAGKTDSAKLILQEELDLVRKRLNDTSYRQGLPIYSMAAIHAMHGEKAESLKWLRKYSQFGFEMGSEWYIAHDPLFDEALRDAEFFADFMQIVQKAQARKNAIREKLREMEELEN
jgi:hypothetical protein